MIQLIIEADLSSEELQVLISEITILHRDVFKKPLVLQQTPCKTLLPPDLPTFEEASNAIEDKSYREFAGEWDRKNGARLMYAQIKKMLTGGE